MERYRVKPDENIKLKDWDPDSQKGFDGDKAAGEALLKKQNQELDNLQDKLYAEGKHKILIVLQGMDTSGKDGVIRNVFEGVNPQGVRIANFKAPTPEELGHDYLWRIHKQTPQRGEIVVFNRSHYEDVLVVRVHSLVPETVWKKRYQQINEFERILVEEGTTILKYFLYISFEEQKEQLQERLDDPKKHWKFNPGDLEERKLWPQYIEAYEEVLSRTSTKYAPWFIVPSNRRWFQRLLVSSMLVETLKKLDMKYPEPAQDFSKIVIE